MVFTGAIASENPFAIELSFEVQPTDLDARGVVSELSYLRWLEYLRIAFFQQQLPPDDTYHALLTSTQIAYKQPLTALTQVTGRLWLANLGKTQWTLQTRLAAPQGTIATAVQSGYWAGPRDLRPTTIPDTLAQPFWDHQWSHSS